MKDNEVKKLANIDEVLQREVLAAGNGARLNIPKKHIGKQVKIIILKEHVTPIQEPTAHILEEVKTPEQKPTSHILTELKQEVKK